MDATTAECPLQTRRPTLSLRKRWAFRLAFFGLVGLAVEVCSCLGYVAVTHSWPYGRAAGIAMGKGEGHPAAAGAPRYRYMMLHPYLGFVGEPSQTDAEFFEAHDQLYPINDYGFVDVAPPIRRRAPGKLLVGITGGSVACYFSLHGAAALAEHLQRDPRFSGLDIEFVRLAVLGHKQPQQLMTLNYVLALGGELDVLVNIDGFNEVALYPAENAAAGIHPLFPRMWDQYVAASPDPQVALRTGEIGYVESQRAAQAAWLARSPLRYLATVQLVCHVRDRRWQQAAYRAGQALLARRPAALRAASTGPRATFGSDEAMYDELVDIWQRCSRQMDAICRAHGIAYYHFLQPNQYVAGAKPLGPAERRAAYVEDHPYRPGVVHGYPRLRAAGRSLAEAGVRFRDLTDVFADHEEPLYYDACCHFVHAGNEIMAAPIAAEIAAHFSRRGDGDRAAALPAAPRPATAPLER